MTLLLASGLDVAFSERSDPVCRAVCLSVGRGQVIVVEGPNGSGKTCLLRTVAGQLNPRRGILERQVRPVFLSADQSLFENLSPRQVARVLDGFGDSSFIHERGLSLIKSRGKWLVPPRRWNGGTRRLYQVTIAIQMSKDLTVLDEPYEGLDEEGVGCVEEMIRLRRESGVGFLVSNHRSGVLVDRSATVSLP